MEQPRARLDNRVVAINNELAVLKVVRDFGHVRRAEIARAVWPATESAKMVQRTVRRLVARKYLVERENAFRETSLVLSTRGAERLLLNDIQAHDGYALTSMNGPQYVHRLIATRYLIERQVMGHEIFSEYALTRGWAPLTSSGLSAHFGKCPDGLVLVRGPERHYVPEVRAVDWIEVESSAKSLQELERICALAWGARAFPNAPNLVLDRIVFVYDGAARRRHASAIATAVRRYAARHPFIDTATRDAILSSIVLVKCEFDVPFVWRGCEETRVTQL
jgi:hypothetical protein